MVFLDGSLTLFDLMDSYQLLFSLGLLALIYE